MGWEGREAHPVVQEVSREPSGGLGGVGRPTWRSGSCQKAHLEVQEGAGGPLGGPGVVRRPIQRCGRGREALPLGREDSAIPPGRPWKGRKASPERWKRSEGPPGGPGGVRKLSRRAGCGRRPTQWPVRDWEDLSEGWKYHPEVRKAHPDVQEGLGGLSECPEGDMKHSRWPGRCREALPLSREVLEASRRSERGREAHAKVQEGLEGTPRGPEDPHGSPGGVGRHTRRFGRPTRRSGRSR